MPRRNLPLIRAQDYRRIDWDIKHRRKTDEVSWGLCFSLQFPYYSFCSFQCLLQNIIWLLFGIHIIFLFLLQYNIYVKICGVLAFVCLKTMIPTRSGTCCKSEYVHFWAFLFLLFSRFQGPTIFLIVLMQISSPVSGVFFLLLVHFLVCTSKSIFFLLESLGLCKARRTPLAWECIGRLWWWW